ncbi:hypothetical protein [Spirosoma sp.]|uniref:hypothetical protein n=1 Tax=Spirosoma sp. TaxID=1899569 RepID=UPI0026324286|nr:hypothetical protein [Spirosoma sp.]MCX6216504.1 hypothetical protein [Spirosoma sp.]
MAFKTEDTLIEGVQDDGTAEGVIRAKIVSGELVKVPAWFLDWNDTTKINTLLQTDNNDGTGSGYNLSVVAGLPGIASISTIIYGRVIGIRYRRPNSAVPDFTVVIDGVPYAVKPNVIAPRASNIGNMLDRETLVIIAQDLSDTAHTVELVLHADALASRSVVIYGFLAERRAGYQERMHNDYIITQGTLTIAAVAFPTADPANSRPHQGVKKVWYYNKNTTTARKVTLQYAGSTIRVIDVPAAGTVEVNLSERGLIVSGASATTGLNHFADVDAEVTFTLFGLK